MLRTFARRALPVVGVAFVACLFLQVFLAGLGVFDDPTSFITHREFGYLLGWFTLVMLVLALVGRQRRLVVGLAALTLVQFALQSVFVALRADYPALAALHPLNGFLIILVTVLITRLAWAARNEQRVPAPTAVTTSVAQVAEA